MQLANGWSRAVVWGAIAVAIVLVLFLLALWYGTSLGS